MKSITCIDCIYCQDLIDTRTKEVNKQTGICRRFPPKIIVVTELVEQNIVGLEGGRAGPLPPVPVAKAKYMQPLVDFDWPVCGEFKPKKESLS